MKLSDMLYKNLPYTYHKIVVAIVESYNNKFMCKRLHVFDITIIIIIIKQNKVTIILDIKKQLGNLLIRE